MVLYELGSKSNQTNLRSELILHRSRFFKEMILSRSNLNKNLRINVCFLIYIYLKFIFGLNLQFN